MTTATSASDPAVRADETVDVLIVGGGAGLTASMLLAGHSVDDLLISALPTTSNLPKAHVLNQRTMEIFEDVGVTGPHEDYGRRIARVECWGAGGDDENWRAASAWHQLNLPQIRLEPVLKDRADELSPGRIRFNHELLELEQDDEGVTALVRDNAGEREYRVRCRHLIGADGGRTVAGQIGVAYEGLGRLTETATIHATADLSPWMKDDDVRSAGRSPRSAASASCSSRWDLTAGDRTPRSGSSTSTIPSTTHAPSPTSRSRPTCAPRPGSPTFGEDGDPWCAAAHEIADAHDLPVDAVRIGHIDGDRFDPRCTWLPHREIGPDGAILVRPIPTPAPTPAPA